MTKHRLHRAAFKRQVAEEFITGETLHGLSQRHDISRQLIRIWDGKFEAGALDEDVQAADLIREYESRIAALERLVGTEARLDGIYVIRTSLSAEAMSAADTVRAYKDLARVERAFRTLKSVDLQIRPVHHWIEPRMRTHVFLGMLPYYVEWHLRDAWEPVLFHDHDRAAAERERSSPVAAAAQQLLGLDGTSCEPNDEPRRDSRRGAGRVSPR